jgi:STAM-binding protein
MSAFNLAVDHPRSPQNVDQITKAAQDYEFDAALPMKYWLRSASAMLKQVIQRSQCLETCLLHIAQADSYTRDRDDEYTYLLLFRHAHLILANLEQHPSRNDPANKPSLLEAQRQVKINLKRLETIKPRIDQRYQYYLKKAQEQEARRKARGTASEQEPQSQYLEPTTQQLRAHEHKDLAARMAQKEFSRRTTSRQAPSYSSRRDQEDLSSNLQAIRARVDATGSPLREAERPQPQINRSSSDYRYPTVPASRPPESSPVPVHDFQQLTPPPTLPPKVEEYRESAPARPAKVGDEVPGRSLTPKNDHVFAPSAFLENGSPLRPLFLPTTLRTTFLRLAYKNTLANLETCGFLAGTLMRNAFFVSKLIIPAQTSTSDTCEMTNESQLFDYVDSEDLMILGWIHTHPTQTCFMSSRDLHTHAGYQMMLAESIAIVCAPSKGDTTYGGDWGAYRLTDPPGKKVILNCEKPGVFHPHEVDNIYTDALRPGHVVELKGMEFEVVDLR